MLLDFMNTKKNSEKILEQLFQAHIFYAGNISMGKNELKTQYDEFPWELSSSLFCDLLCMYEHEG
jgi:hypothetical protein